MKNKKENIIVVAIIIIAVSAFSFNYIFTVGDELWNFSNMYKMSQGYTIYKDLNVIITPLNFYIGALIFKIFGANVLINKILNTCICTIFFFLIYKIFRKLKIGKLKSGFYTMLLYTLLFYICLGGTNYNILAIVFCFCGILCLIENRPNFVQGIILFLIFMTKQNIGIYYCIGYTSAKIVQIFLNKNFNKEKIKKTIKDLIVTYGIFIGLFAIYLLFLYFKGNLYNFIDYAFLGISEFANKNFSYAIQETIYFAIIVVIEYPLVCFMLNFKNFNISNEIKINTSILMSFSAPLLFIAYPIVNKWHIDLAITTSIILLMYVLDKILLEELTDSKIIKNFLKTIIIIFIIIITIFSIIQNISYYKSLKNYNYYNVYYGAVLNEDTKEDINEIINYINNQKNNTIILSYYSNLYMNVLNKNNGKMDLPFCGNLGKAGENGLINEIKELKDTNLLILKEEDKQIQESKVVRNYVMENYEQIGEIGRYLIYKIN